MRNPSLIAGGSMKTNLIVLTDAAIKNVPQASL